jgi:hypothetical protein
MYGYEIFHHVFKTKKIISTNIRLYERYSGHYTILTYKVHRVTRTQKKTEHTYKGRTAECSNRITRVETSVSKNYVQRVLDIYQ